MRHLPHSRAFSLIEVLVAFVILALLMAFLVPQYLKLQRQANIQIALQQCDAMHRGILAWSTAQNGINAFLTGYDPAATPDSNGRISSNAFNAVQSTYIDSNLAQSITYPPGSYVTYFQTPVMQSITPTASPPTWTQTPLVAGAPATPSSLPSPVAAFAVVYWTTNLADRSSSQPSVILFTPK